MASLLEMAANIVTAHAGSTPMTSDQIVQEIQKVLGVLKSLEGGEALEAKGEERPALSIRQAFKKDEVICLVCGKGGFKTLKKHLDVAHNLKPGQYRRQFGIKSTQALAAKSFSELRRKAAVERGLVDVLAKAREVRRAGLVTKEVTPAKPAKAKTAKKATTAKPSKPVTAKSAKA